jgi:cell division protein FtsB
MPEPSQPKPTPDQIANQAFIQVVFDQRNAAQNGVAQLAAQNALLANENEELKAENADLKTQLATKGAPSTTPASDLPVTQP